MYEKKDLESKLLHSLLNNGMYDMLDIFYKETHCPINFFTSDFKAIKFAPDQEIGDYIWDNILKSEIIPPDIMKFLSDKELIKKGYLSKNAFAVPKDKNMVRSRAVGVVASKNKIIGYLTVYYTSEVTAEDLELLNTLSKMMSLSFFNVENSPTQVKSCLLYTSSS